MKLNSGKILVGTLMVSASGLAFAQTSGNCSSPLSAYSSYIANGQTSSAQSVVANHPECFAGGAVLSNTQINATAFTQAGAISRAIASRISPQARGNLAAIEGARGLAAGGVAQAWNVWTNVEQNDTRFDYNRTRGANDVLTAVVGADYALSQSMVVGVSAAFDNGNSWSRNAGGARNRTDTDGYIVAPYLGYQISKELAFDVSAGVGSGDFSGRGGVKADADRWFAAANLSYARWLGNWQFSGKASYMHGEEDYEDTRLNGVRQVNTGSKNKLGQARLGAQAGYWMNGFMPYAGLSYMSNVHRSSDLGRDPLGRSAFVGSVGVNFFSLSNKISGGVAYEQDFDRKRASNQVFMANVNFRF